MPLNKEVVKLSKTDVQFECQVVDSKEELVPLYPQTVDKWLLVDWYYKDITLRVLYNKSPYLTLNFRNDRLPNRCNGGYALIYNILYTHMKSIKKVVYKRSVAKVVNSFVKNISRTTFYNVKSLRYSRHKDAWNGNKNGVNNKTFLELVSVLEDKGLLETYTGFHDFNEDINVSSLLVLSTELVSMCTGALSEIPKLMEDCLIVEWRLNNEQP